MIEPGIYLDLSNDDYHNDKDSISRSGLMDFKRCPRRYWANYLNPLKPPKEDTPSLILGQAFHALVLQEDLFNQQYFLLPPKVLLKDVGREKYDEYKAIEKKAEETKKTVLSRSDYIKLCEMRDSLYANERARGLIEGAIYESSYFWQDEHSGLILKSRPDILHRNMYVDLKTIDDASPKSYQHEMAKYGYHIQAAMVKDAVAALEGHRLDAFINICIEKKYPYNVGIYEISAAAVEVGHYEYKQICLDLKSAIGDNCFRDYEIQTIDLPKWYN